MDNRCPLCKGDLGKRKFSHAVVARIEIDCSHCKRTIRVNVHRSEVVIVLFNFGAIVVLVCLAYWLRSQGLLLFAFAAAMAGALALPVLERTYLRTWPRYVAKA